MSGSEEPTSPVTDTSPDERRTGATAILLAAGGGSRFDGDHHKLLADLPSTSTRPAEPVVARSFAAVATTVRDGALDAVIVVTGAADIDEVVAEVSSGLGIDDRTAVIHNRRWAEGQATSIQVGLVAATERGADVAVIGLADQPDVRPSTWAAVVHAATVADATPIAVATYDDRPRNPVAIHRVLWPELPTVGDEGARQLIRVRGDLVTRVPSAGSPADIDTVEDLRRWQST